MSKEKRMKDWKLDEEYTLIFGGKGLSLEYESSEPYMRNVKGTMMEVREKKTFYYGTLYQALQGYVKKRLENGEFDISNIRSIMDDIDFVMDGIQKKYKVVKVTS